MSPEHPPPPPWDRPAAVARFSHSTLKIRFKAYSAVGCRRTVGGGGGDFLRMCQARNLKIRIAWIIEHEIRTKLALCTALKRTALIADMNVSRLELRRLRTAPDYNCGSHALWHPTVLWSEKNTLRWWRTHTSKRDVLSNQARALTGMAMVLSHAHGGFDGRCSSPFTLIFQDALPRSSPAASWEQLHRGGIGR